MGKFTKSFMIIFFALILSLFISSHYAFAEGVGRITYAEGRVDRIRVVSEEAIPLVYGDIISAGDSVRTKSNSKAEITFNDNSIVRLAQNSKVDVKDYQFDERNKRKTATILLERGKARTIISKTSNGSPFNINTPNAEGTVKGSDIFTYYQTGNSGVLVAEGKLSLLNPAFPDKKIEVPAGSSAIVPLDDAPKGPRAYFDIEKKLHEQDTAVPVSAPKLEKATVIKGRINKFSGSVTIISGDEKTPHDAKLNEVVGEGDTVTTGSDGMVEIALDNGNSLSLKNNTNIKITRLAIDPKTGEYENLFESDMGKIRARIEGLKGKSRFEVKTPTAVSGARGTIIYLEISALMTKVFFEGGGGYIKNLISGLEKTVEIGQNAYADNAGSTSDSTPTSEGERVDWGSGWDPGSGVEGYSAPEGTVGLYLSESDTGAVTVLGGITAPESGGAPEPIVLPPTAGQTETQEEEEINEVVETATSSSNIIGENTYYESVIGSFAGLANFTGSFWNAGDEAQLISRGNFNTDGSSPFIWHSTGNHLYSNNAANDLMTTDGGAFHGVVGGIGGIGIIDGVSVGIMEGIAQLMYVDPNGNSGVAGGRLFGLYSDDDDAYLFGGNITGTQYPAEENIGVTPENFFASLWDNDGRNEDLYTASLVNHVTGQVQHWGIYGGSGTGILSESPAPGASWHVGGTTSFGAYYNRSNGEFYHDWGYWLAKITNDSTVNSKLAGSFIGKFLTYTKMGEISGAMLGRYNDDLEYQAISAGVWEGEPLNFSGNWGEELTSLYSNDNGNITHAGEDWGLIGAITSPWRKMATFLAMGEYQIYNDDSAEPYLWNTEITSHNAIEDSSRTIDGGIFSGFTAGIWNKDKMDGSTVAIYIDPDGNAGFLTGPLWGDYYTDSAMWMSEGILTPTIMEQGMDPEKDLEELDVNELLGTVYNDDEDGLVLIGATPAGYSHTYSPYTEGMAWGIYSMKLGDGTSSAYYRNPEGSKIWGGVIAGEGVFGYDDSVGIMNGNVFGTYYSDRQSEGADEGYWIATGIGTWRGRGYGEGFEEDGEGEGENKAYYGFLGGIWDEGIMLGKMLALYGTASDFENLRTGSLSLNYEGFEGSGIGGFDDGGDISITSLEGMTLGFEGQDWSIWGAKFGGTCSDPTSIFTITLTGASTTEGPEGTDVSYFLTLMGGVRNAASNILAGFIRGITIQFRDDNTAETGLSSGDILGVLKEEGGDSDQLTLEAAGMGEWSYKGTVDLSDLEETENFTDFFSFDYISGAGLGNFENGGSIQAAFMDGMSVSVWDARWGIWLANLGGTYSDATTLFRLAIGGGTPIEGGYSDYTLATIAGYNASGELNGRLKGIWLAHGEGSTVRAGMITGDVTGYIDVDGINGTWNAVGVGEWVEVTDLLDENAMFGKDGLSGLNEFVSVPITEVYSSLMTGPGTGGVTSAIVDMSLYAISPAALEGIWTALVIGAYSGEVSSNWTATVTNGGDQVTLTGTQWNAGEWLATVSGTVGGNTITNGQAGGTYSNDGTFSGVGAGNYTQNPPAEAPPQ